MRRLFRRLKITALISVTAIEIVLILHQAAELIVATATTVI